MSTSTEKDSYLAKDTLRFPVSYRCCLLRTRTGGLYGYSVQPVAPATYWELGSLSHCFLQKSMQAKHMEIARSVLQKSFRTFGNRNKESHLVRPWHDGGSGQNCSSKNTIPPRPSERGKGARTPHPLSNKRHLTGTRWPQGPADWRKPFHRPCDKKHVSSQARPLPGWHSHP